MLLVKTVEGYVGSLLAAMEDGNNNDDSDKEQLETTAHEEEEQHAPYSVLHHTAAQQAGVRLQLSRLLLDNVAAVEPLQITLQVACVRCHKPTAATLQPDAHDVAVSAETCMRCHASMEVRMAPQLLHEANDVLGHVRCNGCVAMDLLPCMLGVQCAVCSAGTALRDVQVGLLATKACRRCHTTMGLFIAAALFVDNSTRSSKCGVHHHTPRSAPHNNNTHTPLIIVPGTPLPATGTCRHYRHSHRWFRFPCCGQRFPCDLCHEEAVEDGHPVGWANRMVCGFCSSEQAVAAVCAHCDKRLATSAGMLRCVCIAPTTNGCVCPQRHRVGDARGFGKGGRDAGTRGCWIGGTGTSTGDTRQ